MLLINRRKSVEEGQGSLIWNAGMKGFEFVFSKRGRLDLVGGKTKNTFTLLGANALGNKKQLPHLASQSFSKQWTNKK